MDFLSDWGLEIIKELTVEKINERRIRKQLLEFLERQALLNDMVLPEEEIDFEGLCNYIRRNLISDIKDYIYCFPENRTVIKGKIMQNAVHYAQAKTNISSARARQLTSQTLSIILTFYKNSLNLNTVFAMAEIEEYISNQAEKTKEEAAKAIVDEITPLFEEIKISLEKFKNTSSPIIFEQADENDIIYKGRIYDVFMDHFRFIAQRICVFGLESKSIENAMLSGLILVFKDFLLKYAYEMHPQIYDFFCATVFDMEEYLRSGTLSFYFAVNLQKRLRVLESIIAAFKENNYNSNFDFVKYVQGNALQFNSEESCVQDVKSIANMIQQDMDNPITGTEYFTEYCLLLLLELHIQNGVLTRLNLSEDLDLQQVKLEFCDLFDHSEKISELQ